MVSEVSAVIHILASNKKTTIEKLFATPSANQSMYKLLKKDEDKAMKKRITAILTLALSATLLLSGCGGSSGKGTTPKSIVDSKERTITYVTENFEKDSKPKKVIVFENGVATLYNTGDYTMGDFA